MFEIGKRYDFETFDSIDQQTAHHHYSGVIVEVALPLIKIRRDFEDDEIIINTSSHIFLSAKLDKLQPPHSN